MDEHADEYWIVLANDGRHVDLGKRSKDLATADPAGTLASLDTSGWLAVMHGRYYGDSPTVTLSMVETFGDPTRTFEAAAEAFAVLRSRNVALGRAVAKGLGSVAPPISES